MCDCTKLSNKVDDINKRLLRICDLISRTIDYVDDIDTNTETYANGNIASDVFVLITEIEEDIPNGII